MMNLFTSSKIILNSEAVAGQLRKARQKAGINIEEIARKLKISVKYLKILEDGEFNKLPSGIYGKNFLREYAKFLKIENDELESCFNSEDFVGSKNQGNKLFIEKVFNAFHFSTASKIIKNVIIVLAVAVCFAYLAYYLNNIIAPPELVIISPLNDVVIKEYYIDVNGRVEAEAELVINGELVLSDHGGVFIKRVNLKSGINTIFISAKKKYSKEKNIIRRILVNDK